MDKLIDLGAAASLPILGVFLLRGEKPPSASTNARKKLLAAEEVAEQLGVTSRAVRSWLGWLDNGELVGSKIGRVWRVRQENLDAFVDARSNRPKQNLG